MAAANRDQGTSEPKRVSRRYGIRRWLVAGLAIVGVLSTIQVAEAVCFWFTTDRTDGIEFHDSPQPGDNQYICQGGDVTPGGDLCRTQYCSSFYTPSSPPAGSPYPRDTGGGDTGTGANPRGGG